LYNAIQYLFNTNRQTPTKPHTKYSSYTAPTPLDIKQEVEQIKANVFYSTFLNVFLYFATFFKRFLTFFKKFF